MINHITAGMTGQQAADTIFNNDTEVDGKATTAAANATNALAKSIANEAAIFTKSAVTPLTTGYAVGAIRKTGTADNSATTYKRTSVTTSTAMFAVAPNTDYFYSGQIDSATYAGIAYYTSALVFISYECGGVGTYTEQKLTIPPNAAFIGACANNADPVLKSQIVLNRITVLRADVDAMRADLYKYQPLAAGLAVGAITKSGTTAAVIGSEGYRRTSVANTNMFPVQAGKQHFYTGTVDNAAWAGVCYYTSAFVFISYECGGIEGGGVYTRQALTIPAGAVYIGSCAKTVDPVIEVLVPTSSTTETVIHINQAYAGTGEEGTIAKPFKTINAAIAAFKDGAVTYLVHAGIYRENMALGSLNAGKFRLIGKEAEDVRVYGSNALTGWTATAGYSGVYDIPFALTIPVFDRLGGSLLFEDGNPSMQIEARHYHPLQKNLQYRLPFTPILPKTTIAEVAANAATYAIVGGRLYLRPSSGDPTTNGFTYEHIVRSMNSFVSGVSQTKIVDLDMKNIQMRYGINGFISNGLNSNRRYSCSALAMAGAGAFENRSGYVETWYEEAGYCNNDGENSHFSSGFPAYATFPNNRCNYPTVIHRFLWSHDNADDGESSHEQHNVAVMDSLLEFNGDSGSRPSNDATYFYANVLARKNGWEVTKDGVITPARGGEGFSVVNPAINPARLGCRAFLFNCISEENNVGYAAITQASNYLEGMGCISRNNNTEIYAAAGAKVVLRNFLVTNTSGNVKVTASGGTIEVRNDVLLAP